MEEKIILELTREEAFFLGGLLNKTAHNRLKGLTSQENTDIYFTSKKILDNIVTKLNQ